MPFVLAGCSFATLRAPASDPGTRPVDCSREPFPIIVDLIGAVAIGSVASLSVYTAVRPAEDFDDGERPILIWPTSIVTVAATIGLVASGIYGIRTVRRCGRYQQPLP